MNSYDSAKLQIRQVMAQYQPAASVIFRASMDAMHDPTQQFHELMEKLNADEGAEIKPTLSIAGSSSNCFEIKLPYAAVQRLLFAVAHPDLNEVKATLSTENQHIARTVVTELNKSDHAKLIFPLMQFEPQRLAILEQAIESISRGEKPRMHIAGPNFIVDFNKACELGFVFSQLQSLSGSEQAEAVVAKPVATPLLPAPIKPAAPYIIFTLKSADATEANWHIGNYAYSTACPRAYWDSFSSHYDLKNSHSIPVNGAHLHTLSQKQVNGDLSMMGIDNHPVKIQDEQIYHCTAPRNCPWNDKITGEAFHMSKDTWIRKKEQIESFQRQYGGIICCVNNFTSGYSLLVDGRYISQFQNELKGAFFHYDRPEELQEQVMGSPESSVGATTNVTPLFSRDRSTRRN